MKLLTSITFLVAISATISLELDGCLCKIGSHPRRDVDESIKCWGNEAFQITDCIARAPSCLCSGQTSQVLETDEEVGCAEANLRQVLKKWPCENKQDWLLYLSARADNDAKQSNAKHGL